MRCNGHLLLNAEKMSKSTGNFKTLRQAIKEYGADAMRIALADAGDALDDANFEHGTANSAVLRLTRELEWISAVLGLEGESSAAAAPATRTGEFTFADRVFDNEINAAVARGWPQLRQAAVQGGAEGGGLRPARREGRVAGRLRRRTEEREQREERPREEKTRLRRRLRGGSTQSSPAATSRSRLCSWPRSRRTPASTSGATS